MALKVHGHPLSPAVRRVIACLEEKCLPYEFVFVDLMTGQQTSQAFLSLNPFGKVPAFEDGDLTLFESRAITQYVVRAYADKGTPLIPVNPKGSGLVILWSEVESQQFDPVASKLSYEILIKPLRGMTADEAEVEKLMEKLGSVLDIYEARLKESKFLAGEDFSLADLSHQPAVNGLLSTKVKVLFEARPNVHRWAKEILARPAWQKTLEKMKFP